MSHVEPRPPARQREIEAQALAVVPPCPSWCALPTGHPYDSTASHDPSDHLRLHLSEPDSAVREVYGRVEAEESNRLGEVHVDPATVAIYDDHPRDLTAHEARLYAGALVEAADLLGRIKAS